MSDGGLFSAFRNNGEGDMNRVSALLFGLVALLGAGMDAAAQDKLKVAVPQRGAWDAGLTELGNRGGIFKKHGIVLDLLYLEDVKEIIQSVISGRADIGLAVGAISVIRAYVFGAPIRIIGATLAGSSTYWYVLKSSPIQTVKDIAGKTVAYERNGSSSQYDAIDFMRTLRPSARLVPTGGAAATLRMLAT
jgi:NitT/TauT family transport system substrate-binding protein